MLDRRDARWIAGIVAIVVVAYHRVVFAGFVNWDDNRFITDNPLFDRGGWDYVAAAWTRVQFDAYHPLHLLAYLPDRYLWPDEPVGFHATSLAIFALDLGLAYALVRRHARPAAAAAACLLIALHPLCVEPVAWISARKDVLALAFFLGALLVEDRREASAARPSVLALGLGAAAILTKTSTICLPLVLAAWLRWIRGASPRVAVLRALPYTLFAAAASIAVILVWSDHGMIPPARPAIAPVDVAATLATYVSRVAFPVGLSPVYPVAAPHAIAAAVAFAIALVGVVIAWRRLPPVARFALIAFLAGLLPVANIVPVVFRFADRYALLAIFTLGVPLAVAIERLANRRAIAVAVTIVILMVGEVALTWRLTASWHDSRALWDRAVLAQPAAPYAHLKRGETLRDLRAWSDAIAEYQTAIRLDPDASLGYAGLLYVYASRAEAAGAIRPGTAARWLSELGPALRDARTFARFYESVPHDACAPCSNLLLGMGLLRWPEPDDVLIAAARRALDAGARDVALIYLASVTDRARPGFAEAARRAGIR